MAKGKRHSSLCNSVQAKNRRVSDKTERLTRFLSLFSFLFLPFQASLVESFLPLLSFYELLPMALHRLLAFPIRGWNALRNPVGTI